MNNKRLGSVFLNNILKFYLYVYYYIMKIRWKTLIVLNIFLYLYFKPQSVKILSQIENKEKYIFDLKSLKIVK